MVTIIENAQKVSYIVSKFPELSFGDIMELVQLPSLDIDAALWRAQDMGWIEVDKKKEFIRLIEIPRFSFGEEVEGIKDRILYAFKKLGELESDMDDFTLGKWLLGFVARDAVIALKQCLDDGTLCSYTIIDSGNKKEGDNEYTFYTLPENLDKKWGKKQFKNQRKLRVK